LIHIDLEVVAELWGDLVQASDQRITVRGVDAAGDGRLALARAGIEHALFNAIVQIEPVDTTSNSTLTSIQSFNGQIK